VRPAESRRGDWRRVPGSVSTGQGLDVCAVVAAVMVIRADSRGVSARSCAAG
jgi:hypothetical protein